MSKRSNREVEGPVQGEAPRKATKISNPLAIYNQRVIRKFTRALDENPQVNLLDVIPASYARRFQEESEVNEGEEKTDNIGELMILWHGDQLLIHEIPRAMSSRDRNLHGPNPDTISPVGSHPRHSRKCGTWWLFTGIYSSVAQSG